MGLPGPGQRQQAARDAAEKYFVCAKYYGLVHNALLGQVGF